MSRRTYPISLLAIALGACRQAPTLGVDASAAAPPASVDDPTLLPPLAPVVDPVESTDGIETTVTPDPKGGVDVQFVYGSAQTFVGDVEFTNVWIGPTTGDVLPWRVASDNMSDCIARPTFSASGTYSKGFTTTWNWDPQRASAYFCRAGKSERMPPPRGRYRIQTILRPKNGAPRTLWTRIFAMP